MLTGSVSELQQSLIQQLQGVPFAWDLCEGTKPLGLLSELSLCMLLLICEVPAGPLRTELQSKPGW